MINIDFKPAVITVYRKDKAIQNFCCEYRSQKHQPLIFVPDRDVQPKRTFLQKLFGIRPAVPVPSARYNGFRGLTTFDAEIRTVSGTPADLYFHQTMERLVDAHNAYAFVPKADLLDDLVVSTDDGMEKLWCCFPTDIEPSDIGQVYVKLGFDNLEAV